jgi:prephenate dehydrogenase
MKRKKKKILIIGLGRFGKLLAEILKNDFTVQAWSHSNKRKIAKEMGVKWVDLEEGIKICEVIFYCVPISMFENIFTSHLRMYKNSSSKLIIDIQSVKVAPKKVLEKYLPKHCQAILTHPIFGPNSVKTHGLSGSKIMMDQFNASDDNYIFWKEYFLSKKLNVIEMSADEHDKQAAISQGVVFFIAKVLEDFGFSKTLVDTYWAEQLHKIVYGAVGNDTNQLFIDLQTKNPYTKKMRDDLGRSLDKTYNQLLPKKVNSSKVTFGIQGGVGSFNHEMLLSHIKENNIKNFEVKYLFTSKRVLDQLHKGNIDYGLMATHNSVGGIVTETLHAMAGHKFKIVNELSIVIRHFMMKRRDTDIKDIDKVLTHPQVIKQCKQTLKDKYSNLNITSGIGDLIDHAEVAKRLSSGELERDIGVMGPKTLADIYDLEIIEGNLQDSKNNLTNFVLVSR